MQEALKSKERQTIWINRTFKSEIQKGEPNYFDILQNWFPPEIRSPLCNLEKFQGSEKITPNSCRNVWNLMNDEELGSRKLSKLKYRRGDQIIQTFCKIGSPQKLGPPSFISRNFKTLRKVLLNMQNALESKDWEGIWVHRTFKIEIQKGRPNHWDILQNRFPLFQFWKFQESEKSTP